ncbi:SMC-Scp complex subunit ScpB [Pelagibius litoralis]|uniref:SMC-Scp complex subunit ScpB n=1 Tax=Pelagibius litoralis TaxID=374515 RepID=A0A967C343_9PROT|nr:SMC-Scp complex subunit ScpB [Pelagibius litoralis]
MTADFDNLRLIEALLFASAEPLAPAQLARFLPEDTALEPILTDLENLYANRGVNLVKRGERWAFRTASDLAPRMELENKVVRKLSRVALETLAVIAYHQPITRGEIEEIRGVALSKGTLDALLEIGWIRPKGRRKTPGRPVTWGTNEAFLDHFGLESLDALPGVEELKAAGLLDSRPAVTALGDRGLLPGVGEVAQEEIDEDESEEDDGGEAARGDLVDETLDPAFGENLLPHEVDLSATPQLEEVEAGAEDQSAVAEEEPAEAEGDNFEADDREADDPETDERHDDDIDAQDIEDAVAEADDAEPDDVEEDDLDDDDIEDADADDVEAQDVDEDHVEAHEADDEEPQRGHG